MLKIVEKWPDRLIIEKIPVYFYLLCCLLFVAGITMAVIMSPIYGSQAYLLGGGASGAAILLFLLLGNTTLVTIHRSYRVLYHGKWGLFQVKTRRYPFNQINGIELRNPQNSLKTEGLKPNSCDIVIQGATGKNIMLHVYSRKTAQRASELMRSYLA